MSVICIKNYAIHAVVPTRNLYMDTCYCKFITKSFCDMTELIDLHFMIICITHVFLYFIKKYN